MDYDYIGEPWPTEKGLLVGNGSFSLRSKKLLSALQDEVILAKHTENHCICLENRGYLEDTHGIPFAYGALAEQFNFELQKPSYDCFGFHMACNLPLVLTTPELLKLITKLPPKLIFTGQFSQFIKVCQSLNSTEAMTAVKEQILKLCGEMDQELLSSRLYRHIIKTCIWRKLYSIALDTLLTRIKITGWNVDVFIFLLKIYSHKLLPRI